MISRDFDRILPDFNRIPWYLVKICLTPPRPTPFSGADNFGRAGIGFFFSPRITIRRTPSENACQNPFLTVKPIADPLLRTLPQKPFQNLLRTLVLEGVKWGMGWVVVGMAVFGT